MGLVDEGDDSGYMTYSLGWGNNFLRRWGTASDEEKERIRTIIITDSDEVRVQLPLSLQPPILKSLDPKSLKVSQSQRANPQCIMPQSPSVLNTATLQHTNVLVCWSR